MDVRALGLAVVALGGGRTRPQDRIDPRVGLSGVLGLGARVEAGEPLAHVHAATEEAAQAAVRAVQAALVLGDAAPPVLPLVIEAIDA
jgi:thymidine phosphorylase